MDLLRPSTSNDPIKKLYLRLPLTAQKHKRIKRDSRGSLRDFGDMDLGDVYVSLLRFGRNGCKEYACLGRKRNMKFNRFATNIM
jgi:hypothetical protein